MKGLPSQEVEPTWIHSAGDNSITLEALLIVATREDQAEGPTPGVVVEVTIHVPSEELVKV